MTRQASVTPPEEDFGHEAEWRLSTQTDEGTLEIQDDVIARIVEIAVGEVEGVVLESKFALSDLVIGRREKEPVKGIAIRREDEALNSIFITISVRMPYGKDMYELGVKLRRHIKTAVEKMTGNSVKVRRVDIRIVGVVVPRTPQEEE